MFFIPHMAKFKKRNLVCLYWSGYYTICTHQRNPTTAWRGHFELLGFPPGPNRTSLDNLATPGSPKVSMLTPSLVRTLVQHVTQCSRTPVLKPSSNSGLPIAWITEPATDPSQQKQWKSFYIKATIQLFPQVLRTWVEDECSKSMTFKYLSNCF